MRKLFISTGLAVLACVGLTGCEGVYPKPSEDAVYNFLANARLHGKMRVCWKEGQEYAVAVTKADAALQGELDPLRALLTYDASWDRDDPRWADAAGVKEHAEELAKLANEGAKARAKYLADLRAALDKLPAGLSWANDAAKDAFKQRLWTALDLDGEPLEHAVRRLEDLLAARLRLFEKAVACAGSRTDAAEDALTYGDADCQREMNELFAAYRTQVEAERERFFTQAKARLAEIAPVLKTIDKQKEREKYNLLDNEKTDFRTRLEAMQKALRELIKADSEKTKELKKTEPKDSPKLKRLEEEIFIREAQLAELVKRSDSILKQ
jgi:hypothetical protein